MARTRNGPRELDSTFKKLSIKLPEVAAERLIAACTERHKAEARFAPYGTILTELIMKYLPETDAERAGKLVAGTPRREQVKRAKTA